jgi:hypothetical protein
VYTFDVSTADDDALTEQFTFTFTLTDLCDAPTLDTVESPDQVYTISTVMTFSHPDFIIDPSYCPIFYSYEYDWSGITIEDD